MHREYDLFERQPDGSVLWQTSVVGLDNARVRMLELATKRGTEHFALHAASGSIMARVGPEGDRYVPRVFQIGYAEGLMQARTALLRQHGCEVISVVGNTEAKGLLGSS